MEQSHFIRVYDTVKKRETEYSKLPGQVRARIESIIQMPQLPDKEVEEVEEVREHTPAFDMSKDIEALRKELT